MPEPGPARFTLSTDKSSDAILVRCSGRLVAGNTEILFSEVKRLLPGSKRIRLDFANVRHIDSSGIGVLMRLYLSAKTSGCSLQLTNLGKPVRQLLGVARVLEILEGFTKSSKDATKHAFGATGSPEWLFNPKSVALVSAEWQPTTLGSRVFSTFLANEFRGDTYIVQPRTTSVAGHTAYPTIGSLPAQADLAIVIAPPETALDTIAECVEQNIRGVILFSSNSGGDGAGNLISSEDMARVLAGSQTRVIGPNALGVMNPHIGLNATPGLHLPLGGTVAFLSDSAMLARTVLDRSHRNIVGLSAFACMGDMLDVSWASLIDYFGRDATTRTIVLQMSSLGNARALLSAAREVSLNKPIIVIKSGQSEDTLRALVWQSQSEVSDAAVLKAAFDRVGVLQVDTLEDLFNVADALSKQPRPRGPRLMLVSNADAPGVLAADSLVRSGIQLADPSDETRAQLRDLLLPGAPMHDSLGDGSAETYISAARIAAEDPNCDALLMVAVPWAFQNPQESADALMELRNVGKPLLLCYLGTVETEAGHAALVRACIPTFSSPETAGRVFQHMWRYSYDLQALYVTPTLGPEANGAARQVAGEMIAAACNSNRTTLTADECGAMLNHYGIATLAADTPVDGNAFRARLGSRVDPQFGPVLMFGAADRGPNSYGDLVVGLPPLNATLARRLLDGCEFYRAILRQSRSLFHPGLIDVLVRFSELLTEQPRIRSFEIGSLVVAGEKVMAASLRCQLHEFQIPDEQLPRPAIRPFPTQYVSTWTMKNGQSVTLRPIRAADEPAMAAFHQGLSDRTVYMRYFQRVALKTLNAHQRLSRVCFLDYDREMALLAELQDANGGSRKIIAVATLVKIPSTLDGEVAFLVSDQFQGQGLGKELLLRLMQFARDEGLRRVVASTLFENVSMAAVFEKMGFTLSRNEDEGVLEVSLKLS